MSDTNFTAIGAYVAKAGELLDSIKGGAIRVMQKTFDDFMGNSRQSVNDFLTQKRSEFSGVLSTAETKAFPYVNLLKNSFAQDKDGDGNLIFPISTYGLAEFEEVLPFDSDQVPLSVRAAYDAMFVDHHPLRPNIIHVRFPAGVKPSYWLPGNLINGRYTLGFKLACVVSGSMWGIQEGQSGEVVQNRVRKTWHIDGQFNAAEGTDVYLVLPYVVAGFCPTADLVQCIHHVAKNLTLNVG